MKFEQIITELRKNPNRKVRENSPGSDKVFRTFDRCQFGGNFTVLNDDWELEPEPKSISVEEIKKAWDLVHIYPADTNRNGAFQKFIDALDFNENK